MTIELKITRHPDGKIDVNGPIQDKFFCYTMLEIARDAIQELHAKQAAEGPRIEVPRMMVRGDITGNGDNKR
jgi:hypothetical protein